MLPKYPGCRFPNPAGAPGSCCESPSVLQASPKDGRAAVPLECFSGLAGSFCCSPGLPLGLSGILGPFWVSLFRGTTSLLMSLELNELEGPFQPKSCRNSPIWDRSCCPKPALGFHPSVSGKDHHQDGSGRGRSRIFHELPRLPVKDRTHFHSPDSSPPGITSRSSSRSSSRHWQG